VNDELEENELDEETVEDVRMDLDDLDYDHRATRQELERQISYFSNCVASLEEALNEVRALVGLAPVDVRWNS
jgi:hypothetical protein